MNTKSAADLYQQSSVENAPPLQIVRMLYKGALRFLTQASLADPVKEPVEFNRNLTRADAIVNELRCSLDPEKAPELSASLEQLYLFCEAEIAFASIDRDKERVENAKRVLTTLYEGWNELDLDSSEGEAGRESSADVS